MSLSSVAAENNKNTILDRQIVYPAGFEANTQEMSNNWYLKTFTNVDQNKVDSRNAREMSDRDYKDRLEKLSKRYGIELPFNPVVKSYIERYVVKNRTQVAHMLGLWPCYKTTIEKELRKNNLPDGLKYIPVACSSLNANAISPAGASGLWQFMIDPAKGNGLEVNTIVDERRDPIKSTEKAAEYLKKLHSSYKDWLVVIAAFNCGIGNVNKAMRRANNKGVNNPDFWDIYPFLPKETRGYVPAFIAATYVMNQYHEHGISPTLTKRPLVTGTTQVTKRVSIHQISQVLDIPLEEIRLLNPQYREDVIPGDIHPYTLTLPSGQINSYRMAEEKIVNYHKNEFARRAEVQPGDIRAIVGEEEVDENTRKGIAYHEVTEDEDLYDIASRYGMQLDDLMELNNLTSSQVQPGKILTIQLKGRNGGDYRNETVMNNRNNNSSSNNNYSRNNNNNNNERYASSSQQPKHYGSDPREVPQPRREASQDDNYNQQKKEQEELNRQKRQQEAEKRRQQEAAAKKKRDQEIAAAKKRQQEEAARKRQQEEAAKKRREEEAAKRRQQEEERKRREEAAKPIIHEVKEGNNLTKLAEQYGTTIADIKALNPDLKDENIRIGQKLKIPKKGQHVASNQGKQNPKQEQHVEKQNNKHQQQAARDKKAKAAEEAAKKKAAEEAARKKAAEEAARKKAAEEAKKPKSHVVKEGNNLTKLAEQYGVSVEEIKKANNIKDDNIRIGQKLVIPAKHAQNHQRHSSQQQKNNNSVQSRQNGKKK